MHACIAWYDLNAHAELADQCALRHGCPKLLPTAAALHKTNVARDKFNNDLPPLQPLRCLEHATLCTDPTKFAESVFDLVA